MIDSSLLLSRWDLVAHQHGGCAPSLPETRLLNQTRSLSSEAGVELADGIGLPLIYSSSRIEIQVIELLDQRPILSEFARVQLSSLLCGRPHAHEPGICPDLELSQPVVRPLILRDVV